MKQKDWNYFRKILNNLPYVKSLKPNILYMTQLATGIDGLLIYENTLFLIQIKRSKDNFYVGCGLKDVLKAAKSLKRLKYNIVPWLVDILGGLNPKKLENKNKIIFLDFGILLS